MLSLPDMAWRHTEAMVKETFRVVRDKEHPLYDEIGKAKGVRVKRGNSWLANSEDIVKQVCELDSLHHGAERIEWGKEMESYTTVASTLVRECGGEDPSLV